MRQRVDLPLELRDALCVVHGVSCVRIIRHSSYLLQTASNSCKCKFCLTDAAPEAFERLLTTKLKALAGGAKRGHR